MVICSRGASGGGGNTRIAYGSYNGTGQFGESHKNSLSFDFTPVAVFVGAVNNTSDTAFPGALFRGMNRGHSDYGYSAGGVSCCTSPGRPRG